MVVRAVGDLEAVIGVQVSHKALFRLGFKSEINDGKMINEPHPGYVGLPSLHGFDYNTDLHLSHIRELIGSNLQTIPGINDFFPKKLYSICFPVIPIGKWTSNFGIHMVAFIHYAN